MAVRLSMTKYKNYGNWNTFTLIVQNMSGLEYKFDAASYTVIKFCWISKYKMSHFPPVTHLAGEPPNGRALPVAMTQSRQRGSQQSGCHGNLPAMILMIHIDDIGYQMSNLWKRCNKKNLITFYIQIGRLVERKVQI